MEETYIDLDEECTCDYYEWDEIQCPDDEECSCNCCPYCQEVCMAVS